jgi:aromatic ring-cleaving dioxygenase
MWQEFQRGCDIAYYHAHYLFDFDATKHALISINAPVTDVNE